MTRSLSDAILSLAESIGRESAADRKDACRMLAGAVAQAALEHHGTGSAMETMGHLRREAERTLERLGQDYRPGPC